MCKAIAVAVLLCGFGWAKELPDAPSHARRNFWVAHAGLLAATVYDEEITHQGIAHHRCVEANVNPPYPSRGDLYKNGLAFDAIVTGFDYLLYRSVGHYSQYSGAAVGIIKHVHGGTRWITAGCW